MLRQLPEGELGVGYANRGNHTSSDYRDEDIQEMNKARKAMGLPQLKAKERKCLKCGDKFRSVRFRVCPNCRLAHSTVGYSCWD